MRPSPPEPALGPPPQSPEADRLLALRAAHREPLGPLVLLERARASGGPVDLGPLEAWARQERRWSTLVDVVALGARLDSGARRVELSLEAAALARQHLHRLDLALEHAESARGPRSQPAVLLALSELYELAGRPADALAALEQLVQAAYFPRAEHTGVALRLWRLAASPRVDAAVRLVALRRATALDPSSAPLREALLRAMEGGHGAWPARAATPPPTDAERARAHAEATRGRSADDPEAIELLRRSLALHEDPPVREALLRALVGNRRFGDLERELLAGVRSAVGTARIEKLCALGERAARAPWSRADIAREAYGNALSMEPRCEPAFDWLLEDARARGDLDRMERLAERRLLALSNPARRTALRHTMLEHWTRAGDAARVSRTLRGLLIDDPHDAPALALCEELLASDAWARGLDALVASADSPRWGRGAGGARADLLAACLRVATARSAAPEVLLPIAARLERLRPGAVGLAETIAALQASAGCDARALATVRARVDGAPSDVARADASCELGTLHRERWELDPAWTAFERALSIDPTHPDALEALDELSLTPELEDRRESVLRRRLISLDAGRSPADRVRAAAALRVHVLRELADLTTDDDEALLLNRRGLELDPTDATAADEVTRLLARSGDAAGLAQHLEERLHHAGPAESLAIGKRLARLYGDELGDATRAILQWHAVAAQAPADDPDARLSLVEAQLGAGRAAEATLGMTALAASLPAGAPRTHLLRRIARATKEPGERGAAWRRILELVPEDPEALRSLYADARTSGDPARHALCHRLARAVPDPAEKAAVLMEAVALEDPAQALGTLRAVLALDPTHPQALRAAEATARGLKDWPAAIEYMERRLALGADSTEAFDLAVAIAATWLDPLGLDEPAARSLERARALQPRNERIIHQLESLYERSSDWPGLARTLRRRLDGTSAVPDRVALLVRMAHLHADRLGEPDAAVDLFRAAHDLDPRQRELDDMQLDTLAAAGFWDKVVARIEARAAGETDPARRAEAWLLVCDLHDRATERPGPAFDAAVRVAREVGPTALAVSLLVFHGRRAARCVEAVAMLDEMSSRTEDAAAGARALSSAATLLERDLGAPSAALDRYLEILRRTGAEARLAEEIERLAVQEGRTEDWIGAELEREMLSTDVNERWEILIRTSRVLDERFGEKERAIQLLLRALALRPDDEPIADLLDVLAREMDARGREDARGRPTPSAPHARELLAAAYSRLARWDKLAELSWARAKSPEGTAEDAAQAAELFTARLANPARAMEAWRLAIDRAPQQRAWLAAYGALLERAEDWAELARVLGLVALVASSEGDRARVLQRRARIFADELGDKDHAIQVLEDARARSPSSISVLRELERSYELAGRDQDLDRLLSDAADRLTGPDDAREVLLRLTRFREARGDLDGAIATLWRAIDVTPGYVPTYAKLRSLLEERGTPAERIDVLVREAAAWTDPAESADRLCEAAAIASKELGDANRARALYQEAIGLHERCRSAARALAEDAERRGDPQAALSWLESLRRWTVHPEEVAALDKELEELLARASGREPEA